MSEQPGKQRLAGAGDILPPEAGPTPVAGVPTPAGEAALAAAQAFAGRATAAATLRAYKADWTHFSQWCAAHGFVRCRRHPPPSAPISPAWPPAMPPAGIANLTDFGTDLT